MAAVAAIGMFDGVHLGHRALVGMAAAMAAERGSQALAVTFSCHPLQVVAPDRAPALLTSPGQRLRLLAQAGADRAIALPFADELRRLTAAEFMQQLKDRYGVDALVMGFNHRFGSDRISDFAHYRRIGAGLGIDVVQGAEVTLPSGAPISSSAIRQLLALGDAQGAAAMLGRPYAVSGMVCHGRRIGSSIGFPTANVRPLFPGGIIPAPGVYAGYAVAAGRRHAVMVNVGSRPTVEQDGPVGIEAHLIGYSGDLYGCPITIEFAHRMRDEQRFASLDSLAARLRADCDMARRLCPLY